MELESYFLNRWIDEEVFMQQSPRFMEHKKEKHVHKLQKELYGLGKSLRNVCMNLWEVSKNRIMKMWYKSKYVYDDHFVWRFNTNHIVCASP